MAKKSKKEFYQKEILSVLEKNGEVKVLDITTILGDYNYPKMMLLTHELCKNKQLMRIGRGDSVKWIAPSDDYIKELTTEPDITVDFTFSQNK